MSLPVWHNFRTVAEMIKETAGATDCKRFCSGCAKTWKEVATGNVHMVEDIDNRTPCESVHKFYCDGCIGEVNN